MRAVIQRVSRAEVRVDNCCSGRISSGLLIFLGVKTGDSAKEAEFLADKCANLRIFTDTDGKFNLSLHDTGGAALVISQFTVYADTRRGRRPSFTDAAPPDVSEPLYEYFIECLKNQGLQVEHGSFGAHMEIESVNDGPVTLTIEKDS